MTRDGTTPELDSRELISTLFALLPIPVAVADERGSIVVANSSFTEIFQGVASVSTMPLREMDIPGHGRFQVHALPMNDRGYKIIYATEVSVASKLAEKLDRLEKLAAIGRVVGGVANEIHNPLKDILEYGPMVEQCEMDDKARTIIQTVFANAERAGQLVQNLVTFAGASGLERVPIDLNEIVRNVARLFQAQLCSPQRLPIECKLELADDLEPIAADPDLLHRALSNLVLNAMDAMPKSGALILRTQRDGSDTRIEVSDTGKGLTPEECERLFTPYYTSKEHGTGLGLAIVQSVVNDHGGRISVRSKQGLGTTFVIELPDNMEKLSGLEHENAKA